MVSPALRRYASDGVLVIGGARAILLQVADPAVAAGVARHSDFAHRPVERLRNTLTFAYAVVLGRADDAARVAALVNHAHLPVAGAAEAERQLWVAATLYDTAAIVHSRVFGCPDANLAAEALAEYARLGTALQMPAELWPASVSDFDRYWATALQNLEVGDDARRVAHDLFHPVTAPLWLRAGLPLARLLSIDLLPASLRDAYGFEWGDREARRARRAWGVIRVLARITPHRLRSWPSRYYLARLRR